MLKKVGPRSSCRQDAPEPISVHHVHFFFAFAQCAVLNAVFVFVFTWGAEIAAANYSAFQSWRDVPWPFSWDEVPCDFARSASSSLPSILPVRPRSAGFAAKLATNATFAAAFPFVAILPCSGCYADGTDAPRPRGGPPAAGSYGWVPDNFARIDAMIAAAARHLGGDPARVTLFGQSAGGASVGAHLVMPASKGLFHAAVMESNPIGLPFRTKEKQPGFTKVVAKKAGCKTGPTQAV